MLELGHEVRSVEERKNSAIARTLTAAGSGPLRAFYEGFPNLQYSTFEPRRAGSLLEWVTRELAMIDVAIAVDGVPEELCRWLANVTKPGLRRVYLCYQPERLDIEMVRAYEIEKFDAVFSTGPTSAGVSWLEIEPALASIDRRVGLDEQLPADLRERLVDPPIAASRFIIDMEAPHGEIEYRDLTLPPGATPGNGFGRPTDS